MTEQLKNKNIMTHEQFVTKETANLAKQAGFDWEIKTQYLRGELKERDDCRNYNNSDIFGLQSYSCPTQSVLQKWLREERGMYIEITHTVTDEFYVTIHSKYFMLHKRLLNECRETLTFPTYEAALEVAEQKCLTTIIKKQ